MSGYPSRVPPIKLDLNRELFNLIIQILKSNVNSEDEYINNNSKKLIEKLLTYSVPIELEQKVEINVRLFNNEASIIIFQLLYFLKEYVEIDNDYYEALKTIRKKKFNKA